MAFDGLSIGLFGGSFNPAHAGHMHVAQCGIRQLGLDHIWWMVSPQNPLKSTQPPYEERVKSVDALGLPFNMSISHMERDFGTQYTIDMLTRAQRRWPRTRFVFLMGADNFAQLPQWKDWKRIMQSVPIAVIARPNTRKDGRDKTHIRARLSPPPRIFSQARLPETSADIISLQQAPAWVFLTPPTNALSSTQIRNRRNTR